MEELREGGNVLTYCSYKEIAKQAPLPSATMLSMHFGEACDPQSRSAMPVESA